MSTVPATAPLLNSRILGQAHHAARALLERELVRTGNTFFHSIALNALAAQGGTAERDAIVEQMTSTLRIAPAEALAALTELTGTGLVEAVVSGDEIDGHDGLDGKGFDKGEGPRIGLTERGRALQSRLAAFAAETAPLVYGDIPEADLAVAGRVLLQVTERANALYARTADRG